MIIIIYSSKNENVCLRWSSAEWNIFNQAKDFWLRANGNFNIEVTLHSFSYNESAEKQHATFCKNIYKPNTSSKLIAQKHD